MPTSLPGPAPASPGGAKERRAATPRAEPQGLNELREFKALLHRQLIVNMDLAALTAANKDQLREEVRRVAEDLCQQSSSLMSRHERERLTNEGAHETFGLGPPEALMAAPTVTDILINGPGTVYVERDGQMELTDVCFSDEAHLR